MTFAGEDDRVFSLRGDKEDGAVSGLVLGS